ncbi:unnamed protein product [Effrenium voratum]|nr:unnamed protein product [Effrenium voratum]
MKVALEQGYGHLLMRFTKKLSAVQSTKVFAGPSLPGGWRLERASACKFCCHGHKYQISGFHPSLDLFKLQRVDLQRVGKKSYGQLTASTVMTAGPDPNWVDTFTSAILSQDYDQAREVLRSAIARGVSSSLAEQYGKVLEEFLQRRDEIENPVVLGQFELCIVRDSINSTGRGLFVPGYQTWGCQLWKQRPLAYIQSPKSRRCVQVCCACLIPVGSLASQLRHMGLVPPPGAEDDILLTNGEQIGEEGYKDGFAAGQVLPCAGCSEVFCSEQCRTWALSESSHTLLCRARLSEERRWAALQSLEQLAEEADHEHLLLLAHTVAQMVLARRSASSEQVRHRFAGQFVSAPWHSLAEGGEDSSEARQQWLSQAVGCLKAIFGEDEFVDLQLLDGLLGTFELVNMCVSLPHPLNQAADDLSGELASQIAKLQETAAERHRRGRR